MSIRDKSRVPGLPVRNCEDISLADVPVLSFAEFRDAVLSHVGYGARLAALYGRPGESGRVGLVAVLANGGSGLISIFSTEVGDSYPSLTPDCPQAHWFEREIFEQWAVRPEGHPWLKPIRFHKPYRNARPAPRPLPA